MVLSVDQNIAAQWGSGAQHSLVLPVTIGFGVF